nr:MAG TPA: hypothetical protein [Caudoviricetes sp.]
MKMIKNCIYFCILLFHFYHTKPMFIGILILLFI